MDHVVHYGSMVGSECGNSCKSLYAISSTKVCTLLNFNIYLNKHILFVIGFGHPVELFVCVQGFGICQCFKDLVTKVTVWTAEI